MHLFAVPSPFQTNGIFDLDRFSVWFMVLTPQRLEILRSGGLLSSIIQAYVLHDSYDKKKF